MPVSCKKQLRAAREALSEKQPIFKLVEDSNEDVDLNSLESSLIFYTTSY